MGTLTMSSGCFVVIWILSACSYTGCTKLGLTFIWWIEDPVHHIYTQGPHCEVPAVARHALSHWFWYILVVGQRECISSEHFSEGCLSRTRTVHLVILVQLIGIRRVLYLWQCQLPSTAVDWHQLYMCKREKDNWDNGFAPSKSEPVCANPASHYVLILRKATNQEGCLDLCLFNMDMKGGILALAIPHTPTGPDALIDAIACGFVAEGKACSTHYSFYHHHITCMMACNYAYSDMS